MGVTAAALLAAAISLLSAAGQDPVIYSAIPDLVQGKLFVAGANLGTDPVVTLGGVPLQIESASPAKFTALIPGSILAAPGTYKLDVSVPQPQPDPPRNTAIDLTIFPVGSLPPPIYLHGSADFTSPGAHNFEVPATTHDVTVELWGGGGRGGWQVVVTGPTRICGGGGGGGGAYVRAVVPVTPGEVLSFTVGAGGTAAAPNGDDTILTAPASGRSAVAGGGRAGLNLSAGPTTACPSSNGGTGGDFATTGTFDGLVARTGASGANSPVLTPVTLSAFSLGAAGGPARTGSIEPPSTPGFMPAGAGGRSPIYYAFTSPINPPSLYYFGEPGDGGPGYVFITW
jgi:hypothetical protein